MVPLPITTDGDSRDWWLYPSIPRWDVAPESFNTACQFPAIDGAVWHLCPIEDFLTRSLGDRLGALNERTMTWLTSPLCQNIPVSVMWVSVSPEEIDWKALRWHPLVFRILSPVLCGCVFCRELALLRCEGPSAPSSFMLTAGVIFKEGTPVEKMPLPDWPVGKTAVHFLDGAQLTVGAVFPKTEVLATNKIRLSKPWGAI